MRIGFAVSLLLQMAFAQPPRAFTGVFIPTRNLTRPRQFHTATLLTNGKVLIAGGFASGGGAFVTWASAELYDPATGTFTAAGDMATARYSHTATLLPDGKVLIAGGNNSIAGGNFRDKLATAELYDPAAGTLTATGNMSTPRSLHTATLLNSGKVLMAGGSDASAELYDPSTGSFAPTGDMTEPGPETATLLPNGKVLITRSLGCCVFGPGHAELYDPATGTFTRTGDMIDRDQGQQPTATLLTNGRVLIAGGSLWDLGGSTSAEIYDPTTGAFTATGKMTADIGFWAVAALLPEGKVLIAGRSAGRGGTAIVYDPLAGTFSAPSDSQSQEGHAATLLPDGTVLLSGGWVCCGATIATAEIYRPAVLVPSPALFSLSGDRQGQGAVLHPDSHQVVSLSNPAVAGEALEVYGIGLIDGSVIPPQVAIGGRMADVLWFGNAPGWPGLNQVNVRVPSGVAPGPAVPVRMTYLSRPSNEVTIAVR